MSGGYYIGSSSISHFPSHDGNNAVTTPIWSRNFILSVYAGCRKLSGILILTYRVAPWTLYSPLILTLQIAYYSLVVFSLPVRESTGGARRGSSSKEVEGKEAHG